MLNAMGLLIFLIVFVIYPQKFCNKSVFTFFFFNGALLLLVPFHICMNFSVYFQTVRKFSFSFLSMEDNMQIMRVNPLVNEVST